MPSTSSVQFKQDRIRQFFEQESADLSRVLRFYAWRAGLSDDENSLGDLLHDVVVEALEHAERYDAQRPPRAWLLGIGANLIRQRSAARNLQNSREPLASDLYQGREPLSEEEVFERLEWIRQEDVEEGDILQREQIRQALGKLSADDQSVIQLFVEGDMSGSALGLALHTTPGAARVRLHRALKRLRALLLEQEDRHE